MFRYLHAYNEETWDAQVKAGFVNKYSGIRFPQSGELEEKDKFNNAAKKGGKLYSILKEMKCPFYIDRLQGGTYLENYDYDMDLVQEYREMLGDNFWGFQMHEWMSNYASDIEKLEKAGCTEWTKEKIEAAILERFPYHYIFLEAFNADEMEANGKPKDVYEYIEHAKKLLRSRMEYTKGDILTCDSGHQALQLEIDCGVKRFMPEIGAQTTDTRVQIAYARGMAKACNLSFGAYIEPWQPYPTYSACFYNVDKQSEWNVKKENFPFEATDCNGGFSRSMQRRMQLYSYMAGAEFIAEEWSLGNLFYDWKDFVISPYGEVKLEFMRFVEKYSEIGKILTPVAIVLPKDLLALDRVREDFDVYVGNSILEFPDLMKKMQTIRNGIRKLFCEPWAVMGSERESMMNYNTFDAIDIVNEDKINLDDYKYIVDLTCGDDLKKRCGEKIVPVEVVKELLEEEMPIIIEDGIHRIVNRCEDGSYYVMLLNNDGVYRTQQKGEKMLSEADVTVKVSVKNGNKLNMLEGDGRITENSDGSYSVYVPAGGWFFAKF